MTMREQVAQQALALTPEDRAYVADVLENSLANGDFANTEISAEWATEIDRRIEAYDRGEVQASDGIDALERIRERLAAHRASKVRG